MRRFAMMVTAVVVAAASMTALGPVSSSAAILQPGPPPQRVQPATAQSEAQVPAPTAGGMYEPVSTWRAYDSRQTAGLAARTSRSIVLAGSRQIPVDVEAVTMNVAVITPATAGSITVFPGGTSFDGASSLSFGARVTEQRMLTVAVGSGQVQVRNNTAGSLAVVLDVTGYYTAQPTADPGTYHPITRQRLLDTRNGKALCAGATRTFAAKGVGSIPAAVGATILSVTVLGATRSGSLSIAPFWTAMVSLVPGVNAQSMVTLPVADGATASVKLNMAGTSCVAVIVDAVGWFAGGASTTPGAEQVVNAPVRTMDSRYSGAVYGTHVISDLDQYSFPGSLPPSGVVALQALLTVLTPQATSSISLYPSTSQFSGFTTTAYRTGYTSQHMLTIPVGSDGKFVLRNNDTTPVSVVLDVVGYVLGRAADWTPGAATTMPAANTWLTAASCPTTIFCAADVYPGGITFYDGTHWSTPTDEALTDVGSSISCVDPEWCMNSNSQGIWHFNGTTWALSKAWSDHPDVESISCADRNFCVVGTNHSSYRWDGTAWATMGYLGLGEQGTVSCPVDGFCAANDYSGALLTTTGTNWTTRPTGGMSVSQVSCASTTFCGLAGNNSLGIWDGTGVATTATSGAGSVSCSAVDLCLGLGGSTNYLISPDSPGVWRPNPSSLGTTFLACVPGSTLTCIGVRSRNSAAWFRSGAWTTPVATTSIGGAFDSVSCPTVNFCATVGGEYADLWDGSAWAEPQALLSPPSGLFTAVSCPIAGWCLATVSLGGEVWQYRDGSWTQLAKLGATDNLTAVSCADVTFCVLGSYGKAYRYDGNAFTAMQVSPASFMDQLSCPSPTFCTAVSGDDVEFWDGKAWGPELTFGVTMDSVSCPSAGYCLFVGPDRSDRLEDSVWSFVPVAGDSVTCTGVDQCVVGWRNSVFDWDGQTTSQPVTVPSSTESIAPISCPSASFCMRSDTKRSLVTLTRNR